MEKIQYLCTRINEVEWSGILLYSVKGSIKEPEKMELHAEDIIPMDKGSAGATEYEYNKKSMFDTSKFDDKHIDYIESMCDEHPEVLEWKVGHIHSHNNMGVFFSGVDIKELEDNAKSHNFYLSLVVNNKMETVAKVVSYAEAKHIFEGSFKAKDENGDDYEIEKGTFDFHKTLIKTFDCQIIKDEQVIRVDARFQTYVDEIIKEADSRPTYRGYYQGNPGGLQGGSYGYNDRDYRGYPYYQQQPFTGQQSVHKDIIPIVPKTENNFNKLSGVDKGTSPEETKFHNKSNKAIEEIDFKGINADISVIDRFLVYLLNNGEFEEGVTVEEFLDLIEEDVIKGDWILDVRDFVSKYPIYYAQCFPEFVEDEDYTIEMTEAVIEALGELSMEYDFLEPLVEGLDLFLKKFKELE